MRGILLAEASISTVDAAWPTAIRGQTAKALCSSQRETEAQKKTEWTKRREKKESESGGVD